MCNELTSLLHFTSTHGHSKQSGWSGLARPVFTVIFGTAHAHIMNNQYILATIALKMAPHTLVNFWGVYCHSVNYILPQLKYICGCLCLFSVNWSCSKDGPCLLQEISMPSLECPESWGQQTHQIQGIYWGVKPWYRQTHKLCHFLPSHQDQTSPLVATGLQSSTSLPVMTVP